MVRDCMLFLAYENVRPSASCVNYGGASVLRDRMLSSWYVAVHSAVVTKAICTPVAHRPMWPVECSSV